MQPGRAGHHARYQPRVFRAILTVTFMTVPLRVFRDAHAAAGRRDASFTDFRLFVWTNETAVAPASALAVPMPATPRLKITSRPEAASIGGGPVFLVGDVKARRVGEVHYVT
ncbi:MAG: hypothetical protein AMJ81_03915 [Phycisphaerae bacterium SM23_33]|nr:MAG: hypothetical protein AMJ81_03915 [Phycisphaerae bacterium SM23_33]